MADVWRPDWWTYPVHCQHGHPWGPGRVIVAWSPCDCAPARAQQLKGPGHLTVRCRAEGCTSIWYKPRHDRASATWDDVARRPGLRCRTPALRVRREIGAKPCSSCTSSVLSACGLARYVFRPGLPRASPNSSSQALRRTAGRCARAVRSSPAARCSLHPHLHQRG